MVAGSYSFEELAWLSKATGMSLGQVAERVTALNELRGRQAFGAGSIYQSVGNPAARYGSSPDLLFHHGFSNPLYKQHWMTRCAGAADMDTPPLWLAQQDEPPTFDDWGMAEFAELVPLIRFSERVSAASVYLAAAFAKASVDDFKPPRPSPFLRPTNVACKWYADVLNAQLSQYAQLRSALLHPWTATAEASPLATQAFLILAQITPAQTQLLRMYALDSPGAFIELASHLDAVAEQIKLAVKLAADLEDHETREEAAANDARLSAIQEALLAAAGEMLSLTQAADRLETSRQALHKRIQRGTALGVLQNGEIQVPAFQLVEQEGRTLVVDGLRRVVEPFLRSGAGHWAALQFLVETDPNLEVAPWAALREGRIDEAAAAARAYLGLEGSGEGPSEG